jgi:hypothetical protein
MKIDQDLWKYDNFSVNEILYILANTPASEWNGLQSKIIPKLHTLQDFWSVEQIIENIYVHSKPADLDLIWKFKERLFEMAYNILFSNRSGLLVESLFDLWSWGMYMTHFGTCREMCEYIAEMCPAEVKNGLYTSILKRKDQNDSGEIPWKFSCPQGYDGLFEALSDGFSECVEECLDLLK